MGFRLNRNGPVFTIVVVTLFPATAVLASLNTATAQAKRITPIVISKSPIPAPEKEKSGCGKCQCTSQAATNESEYISGGLIRPRLATLLVLSTALFTALKR